MKPLLLLLTSLVAVAAADPPATGSDADLRSELDALFREIEGDRVPMLAPDAAPDLVVVSTRQTLGEVGPCG